ncbi:MAG TPA: SpoIVB peptidase S55 domain-containing protein [Bryobacteraceae bacterium]|nr:SpoIVB peptidase S55 domain-containing protein [Bryobacteraceae bacterium]
MLRIAVPAAVALAAALSAQTAFFPLKDLKPGMLATGRTVFSGNHIEDFQVEILGVLENVGPKQSLILARLSGGPLEKTGVLQGMSGSPVYIGGKLVGAVAMAFPFSKEPIAGIRPIEDMVRVSSASSEPLRRVKASLDSTNLTAMLPKPEEAMSGEMRMVDIATPVWFGGFTRATLDRFAPQLRALGLEPRQGVSGGGRVETRMGARAALQPGSMISVALMSGDLNVGADGTVTYIDQDKIYAFGHRFLAIGPTDLPFARSEVLTLLPNLASSFKISAAKEWMGTISQDRSSAITGELGKRARMVPVSISLARAGKRIEGYDMQMANDRFLAPFLMQIAVYSAIDSTERALGAASYAVRGQIEFQDGAPPLKLNNMYAGDANIAMQVSLSAAIPLAYVLQSEFSSLAVKKVALDIDSFDEKKQFQIDQVTVSPHEVRAGDKVHVTAVFVGDNGAEVSRTVDYAVPIGAPAGPLYFTVADGNVANLSEFRQIVGSTPRSVEQLMASVNKLRANTKAYVRVWRAEPNFQLESEDFPDPPPSLALILGASQGALQTRNSKVAELEISAGDAVISGTKTVQVEVKE